MEELSSKLALSLSFDGDQQKYFKFRNRILNFAAENNILNLVIEQPEFDRAMRVANRLVTIPAIYDKLGLIIQEARTEFVAFSDVDLFCEKTSEEINLLKANELTAYKINLESFLKRKSATIKLKDLILEGLSPSVYNRLFSDQEFGTAFLTLRQILQCLDSAYAMIPECDVIAQERKLHNGKESSQSFDDWISSFNIYFALQDKLGTSLTPTAKLNLFRESVLKTPLYRSQIELFNNDFAISGRTYENLLAKVINAHQNRAENVPATASAKAAASADDSSASVALGPLAEGIFRATTTEEKKELIKKLQRFNST